MGGYRRRQGLTSALALEPFQLVECTVELALDGGLVAQDALVGLRVGKVGAYEYNTFPRVILYHRRDIFPALEFARSSRPI